MAALSAVSSDDSRTDLLTSSETSLSFGKYRLTRLLARGGMGEVYLARLVGELGFEKKLVIKTILPELAAKPHFVDMFAAEAKTAVALSHGNIVPIYELGRAGDTFYIVMGHVDGPSLSSVLERCRVSERALELGAALHIARGVLTGLAYAHTAEPGRPAVVHRDITPRNVLVDRSGQVRIVDFGIAAPADAEVDMRGGSTGYAAPEQMRGDTVDPRADVFSAACVLYELVTLERAFPREGVWTAPDLSLLPSELREPVGAALSLEAAARPADAGALLSRLGPAFARHAASYVDSQLAAHLRELFPEGFEGGATQPAIAGSAVKRGAKERPSTQTFATRLTVITRSLPVDPPATAAAGGSGRTKTVAVAAVLALGVAALGWTLGTRSGAEEAARAPIAVDDPSTPAAGVGAARPAPRPVPPERAPSLDATMPEGSGPAESIAASEASTPGSSSAEASPPPEEPPARPTTVALAVTPADAIVTVDGRAATDHGAIEIPAGGAEVVVKRAGHLPRTFTVDATHPLPAAVVLKPRGPAGDGTLAVFAGSVAWAEVTVDGRRVGATPIKKHALPEGTHRVVVTCTDACPSRQVLLQRSVTIRAGELTRVDAE